MALHFELSEYKARIRAAIKSMEILFDSDTGNAMTLGEPIF
jgi:hypothetical protein